MVLSTSAPVAIFRCDEFRQNWTF
ncbi:MAG: hypothetical protein UY01_C0014G0001, partial [Candidatus Nomurabacteria bacterium GW2011_GWB1_47_6]